MKISIYTLGCKTNQFESQAMEKLLSEKGFEIVPFDEAADAYIINSCTVTAVADKKTKQAIRRIKREHRGALVAVCGCMAQLNPEAVKRELDADIVGGNRNHIAFIEEIERSLKNKEVDGGGSFGCGEFCALPAGGLLGRTRALLKIEDGCDNYCSYCIIPYARGRVRSLPFERAVAEAARLSEEGYREIVLTGIEISSYGKDLDEGRTICDLTEAICAAAKGSRISLGSLKPTVITDEFCKRLSRCENLCRHIHLSLQSGDDSTLRRMNRHYTSADIRNAVGTIRRYFENIHITADIICGFPGESEEEFSNTYRLVGECGFGKVHVFPYSVRAGTAAEKMEGKVGKNIAEQRCAAISKLAKKTGRAFLEAQIDREHTVLFEEQTRSDVIGGYTSNYLYAEAKTGSGAQIARGDMRKVRITGVNGDRLSCILLPAE